MAVVVDPASLPDDVDVLKSIIAGMARDADHAYVRDERPHGGERPPAAVFFASPDRRGERPLANLAAFSGVLQADGDVWPIIHPLFKCL